MYYIGFNCHCAAFRRCESPPGFLLRRGQGKTGELWLSETCPAYGILPPGMPGYNANLQGLKFDADKAKQLIADSKYGDVSKLPPIVLTTSGWGNDISGMIGGVIEEWQRNLGVEVTVRQLEPRPSSTSKAGEG